MIDEARNPWRKRKGVVVFDVETDWSEDWSTRGKLNRIFKCAVACAYDKKKYLEFGEPGKLVQLTTLIRPLTPKAMHENPSWRKDSTWPTRGSKYLWKENDDPQENLLSFKASGTLLIRLLFRFRVRESLIEGFPELFLGLEVVQIKMQT